MNSFNFIFANLVLIIAYIFIVLEKIPRVVVALLGASAILVTKVITQEEAFECIDFNVIFLLVGMMILVNILKHTGAIKWFSISLAKKTNGNPILLLVYFSIFTAVLSAFLDNVTTVILVASVTLYITNELKLNPIPFLISEIIASNVGGTATLIGDPPNIMIGSAANLDFNQFIIHICPLVILVFPVVLLTLYFLYKKELVISKEARKKLSSMPLDGVITNKSLMIKSLIVIVLVLIGFLFHGVLHLEAGTIAISGASILLVFENSKLMWDDVEWTTIFFFIGLFIIVGAVEKVGTIDYLSELVFKVTKGDFKTTTLALIWFSAIISAIVDNIPFTATVIPLIQNLGKHYSNLAPLWWSLVVGAGFGGNITIIGAAANVLISDQAKRAGYPISFFEYFKVGALIGIETLSVSTVYIWLRYLH